MPPPTIDEQYRLAELIRWHLEQPPLPLPDLTVRSLRAIAADPSHPLYAAAKRTIERIDRDGEAH
jgi:tRNA U34 2-thiouridine synthase MnmA/TrmU